VQVPVVAPQTHLVEARPRGYLRRDCSVHSAIKRLDPAVGFAWRNVSTAGRAHVSDNNNKHMKSSYVPKISTSKPH
jgi:hypothetical protein